MVEIVNGVKNLKQLNIGKGLQSTPIVNKKGGNLKKRKQIAKGLKILE